MPRRRMCAVAAGLALVISTGIAGSVLAADNYFGPYNVNGVVPPTAAESTTVQNLKDTVDATPTGADGWGNAKELGPKNASTTKIGVIHNAPKPLLDYTNPNAQVDLRQAWVDMKKFNVGTEQSPLNHDFLYFGWERDTNTGSGFIAFEFMHAAPTGCNYAALNVTTCNPWANRAAGDFMLLWDQSGNVGEVWKRTWSDTDPGTGVTLALGAPVQIPGNQAAALYSADRTRGEASVDLTAAGLTDGTACQTIANVIPSTVTGNSDTADYKDTIFTNIRPLGGCTATLVTTPKTGGGDNIGAGGLSIGSGVVAVKDAATLSLTGGTAQASGKITFYLCKVTGSATCTSGGTLVGQSATLSGSFPATTTSPVAYVTSAGRYCWRSEWPGDTVNGIAAATESAATECFDVNAVDPTLTTQADNDALVGEKLSDTATLGGTATRPTANIIETIEPGTPGGATLQPAGGSIAFRLYGPSDSACGTLKYTTSPAVAVSGNGSYATPDTQAAPAYVAAAPGNYHWVASYSGDSPNTNSFTHDSACADTKERVHVDVITPTISTEQAWVPNDTATVAASGGGVPAGTVTFALYNSTDCSGTAIYTSDPVAIGQNGKASSNNTTAVKTSGDYSWSVSYDSSNVAHSDLAASCHETSSVTITNNAP